MEKLKRWFWWTKPEEKCTGGISLCLDFFYFSASVLWIMLYNVVDPVLHQGVLRPIVHYFPGRQVAVWQVWLSCQVALLCRCVTGYLVLGSVDRKSPARIHSSTKKNRILRLITDFHREMTLLSHDVFIIPDIHICRKFRLLKFEITFWNLSFLWSLLQLQVCSHFFWDWKLQDCISRNLKITKLCRILLDRVDCSVHMLFSLLDKYGCSAWESAEYAAGSFLGLPFPWLYVHLNLPGSHWNRWFIS